MRSPLLCSLCRVVLPWLLLHLCVLHCRSLTGCPGFVWGGHNASSTLWIGAGMSSDIAPWISSANRPWHFRGAKSKS